MEFNFNLLDDESKQEYTEWEDLQAHPGWQRLVRFLTGDLESATVRAADSADLKELGYWKGVRMTLTSVIGAATAHAGRIEQEGMEYPDADDDAGSIGLMD